ncbi:hypothetical protein L6452_26770 [Arctium lappa]|uniref:Uncharacterized protein n=1 Tax=Arctium lappa TaxID=4217 RepID=A0ACB8ZV64_ARCLA|nr:hypothetical protein L6452_26770 [Arctium lappa]
MANPSNLPLDDSERIYLCASNTNVSNFVSVKLSSNQNYHIWSTQMLCLMETHDMRGLVDAAFDGPRASTPKMRKQYNSLLKGWIFGSVCQGVLGTVVNFESAKDVWNHLKLIFAPSVSDRQEMKTEAEDKVTISIQTMTEEDEKKRIKRNKQLRKAVMDDYWPYVKFILQEERKDMGDAMRDTINSDKNTIFHIAVGLSRDDVVKNLLDAIPKGQEEEVLTMQNVDGSTALHIAAIVGNEYAAKLLVEKHKELLNILDNANEDPLSIAYYNMQFETFMCLFEAANNYGKTKEANSQDPDDRMNDDGTNTQDPDDRMNVDGRTKQLRMIKLGVDFLVNAISAKQYSIASKLLEKFPTFANANDEVLMALARTFPSGLNHWETLIYPSLGDIRERINKRTTRLRFVIEVFWQYISEFQHWGNIKMLPELITTLVLILPLAMLVMVYQLICLLILMVHFPFSMVYYFSWKMATKLAAPAIRDIDDEQKEWEEAKKVLVKVCEEIGDAHPSHYDQPILEAARRNVYQVVDEILVRSPKAIQSVDKSGYDIIQLAVIHRSEKIYNLIYRIPKRKSCYRMFKDSSGNNMLHLAGRLAQSYELRRRTGAALQLQRELQWHEELKKLVFPAFITEENIFKETPEMVFTREHENLVKEGEKWMKTTAESCSITAALITTIVFAAAITVPGGSSQETGTPLFTNDIAFIIFAISDAISLFTSTTSLLVFLSILTARFAEEDFLVRLPRRLIIGLGTLFISTTAMMVAFSATLFLVFCDKKPWMLAPICGLACFPIVLFVTLQFPLMVDLFWSTYGPIFSNRYQGRFDADEVQGYFANSHHGRLKQMLLAK